MVSLPGQGHPGHRCASIECVLNPRIADAAPTTPDGSTPRVVGDAAALGRVCFSSWHSSLCKFIRSRCARARALDWRRRSVYSYRPYHARRVPVVTSEPLPPILRAAGSRPRLRRQISSLKVRRQKLHCGRTGATSPDLFREAPAPSPIDKVQLRRRTRARARCHTPGNPCYWLRMIPAGQGSCRCNA